MCGIGDSKDAKISIYLGYYGCEIRVNDLVYCTQGEQKQPTTQEEMTKHIMDNYTYEDFIRKLLECIDNGEEG